uniref:Neuronatin n=2 Tax=Sus scrofa TaxID=9823 RepID=A0A8D0K150_PIG
MAAVAAASAELLIIGWYIFRVLLQVSVPGFWVGEGSDARPLNRQARVATAAFPTRPVLIAAIPVCPNAAAGTARPARPLRPPPCVDPSQCARPGTKSWGAAGANRGRSPKLLATNGVFLECCIYWVGFAFRNPPGTQPIARSEVFRYSLQKLAYTVSRTGRHVLGERRQRAPN